ncbi:uncharacterized protein AMSG_02782 [Thecamonas trahens ATCC 50062]|uniref:Uncharacterized protein n=1 Tax=Thecamonas trahens ATCC 50062 TaxID=461836 RepID=A0A0L0D2F2_THETB|nr:hypothetical protein AMSG_02782 [Thecamonas trahens ATCC 50062]KNC46330.1 hypothetical protein AMSG_02782 [Thecamonas trahens ATCC 50062]|eukprot:XP_013760623.1 hypothetical protein AMSG_02782 [Thecamonas trahens ATCC 50062]
MASSAFPPARTRLLRLLHQLQPAAAAAATTSAAAGEDEPDSLMAAVIAVGAQGAGAGARPHTLPAVGRVVLAAVGGGAALSLAVGEADGAVLVAADDGIGWHAARSMGDLADNAWRGVPEPSAAALALGGALADAVTIVVGRAVLRAASASASLTRVHAGLTLRILATYALGTALQRQSPRKLGAQQAVALRLVTAQRMVGLAAEAAWEAPDVAVGPLQALGTLVAHLALGLTGMPPGEAAALAHLVRASAAAPSQWMAPGSVVASLSLAWRMTQPLTARLASAHHICDVSWQWSTLRLRLERVLHTLVKRWRARVARSPESDVAFHHYWARLRDHAHVVAAALVDVATYDALLWLLTETESLPDASQSLLPHIELALHAWFASTMVQNSGWYLEHGLASTSKIQSARLLLTSTSYRAIRVINELLAHPGLAPPVRSPRR